MIEAAPPRTAATSKIDRIRVAVHGADTPCGRELASLLRFHPHIESAREVACDGSVLVGWDGAAEPNWSEGSGRFVDVFGLDVVFVCSPPDDAAPVIMDAVESGARVIDLSGSLREKGLGLGLPEDAGDGETAYGLPEFASDRLRSADHVANAGGLATCATIALGPAAMAGELSSRVEVVATLGISPTPAFAPPGPDAAREEIQENVRHLHRCPSEPRVVLDRQVDPGMQGVLAKTRLEQPGLTEDRVQTLYETFYADSPCIEVLPQGLPTLPAVQGTNKVQVGVRALEAGKVEVACTLDDSLKGAVGQAIQNMNLMCGFPETLGLPEFGLIPPTEAAPRTSKRPDL